ncbi:MAG TPA: 1-deoxy-D-xylulose-5-phosphate reductoisomerase, partial [Candidatus Polarisedimenticolia bacterium]|nr:1-deoxy-D-xylulose-5-phosphate reductoisomerase [Candidatus Polarisedimenticolia bacterium]
KLTFGIPSHARFPCLGLALDAGRRGGTAPAVLAAADEVAVHQFLAGYIRFTDIAHVIEETLNAHKHLPNPSLEQVLEADAWARSYADGWVKAKA